MSENMDTSNAVNDPAFDLKGRTAIVTGAGRGLGRAYAMRLAGRGARVAVVDISLKSYKEFAADEKGMTAETTVEEIQQMGGEAIGFEADITDPEALVPIAKEVFDRWGSVDILIANAGGGTGSFKDTAASIVPVHELHATTERNLYGTIYSCVAVAPYMKDQGYGKIVTIASLAGVQAMNDGEYAHYGAAKAGIAHYTRYLAQDLGRYGVTANCVAPGLVLTGRVADKVDPEAVVTIPRNAAGTVDELANVVLFLSADASSFVNGVVLSVDGGSHIG